MVRTKFVTTTKGISSDAPVEIFLTTGVRWHDLFFGTITASTSAAAALRRHAPTLWGSVIPSSMRIVKSSLLNRVSIYFSDSSVLLLQDIATFW